MIYKAGSTSHGKHFQTCPVTKTFCISLPWMRLRQTPFIQTYGYLPESGRVCHCLTCSQAFCLRLLIVQIILWFTGEFQWYLLYGVWNFGRIHPDEYFYHKRLPTVVKFSYDSPKRDTFLPGRLSSASHAIVWKLILYWPER